MPVYLPIAELGICSLMSSLIMKVDGLEGNWISPFSGDWTSTTMYVWYNN